MKPFTQVNYSVFTFNVNQTDKGFEVTMTVDGAEGILTFANKYNQAVDAVTAIYKYIELNVKAV